MHDFDNVRTWADVGPFDVKCRLGPFENSVVHASDIRSPDEDRSERIVLFTTVDPSLCQDRPYTDDYIGVLSGVHTVGEDGYFRGFEFAGWMRYRDCELEPWLDWVGGEECYVVPQDAMNQVPHQELDDEIKKWPVDADKRWRIEQFRSSRKYFEAVHGSVN